MVVTLVAQGIPLLQRGLWFLLPAVTLALLMVHAMMECVAAFIATSPNKSASSRAALLSRLMALGKAGQPYRLEPSAVGDLDVRFDPVDPIWRARFARVRLTTQYRARLVLDEERHQVRWFEVIRSSGGFIGFQGLNPRVSWGFWIFAGYIDVRWTGWAYGIVGRFPPPIDKTEPSSSATEA